MTLILIMSSIMLALCSLYLSWLVGTEILDEIVTSELERVDKKKVESSAH